MKKKLLLMVLAVVMCFTLVGCDAFKKDENASKKEGIVVAGIACNFENGQGTLMISLGDASTKAIVSVEDIEEPLDANEYGFSSKTGKLLTFYAENGNLMINYEENEIGCESINDLLYTPKAEYHIKNSTGKPLTEFSVSEIPYSNKNFAKRTKESDVIKEE